VRELTDKPFGANIMIINPSNPEILKILAERGCKDRHYLDRIASKNLSTHSQSRYEGVSCDPGTSHAIRAAREGADGIVVSGSESGGLRSMGFRVFHDGPCAFSGRSCEDYRGGGGRYCRSTCYRAALALGAQGVQIGTRFIASEEAPAPKVWKKPFWLVVTAARR